MAKFKRILLKLSGESLMGEQAKTRFAKGDLVVAALRFSTREYNGQVYQDIMVGEIEKLNK